MTARASKQVGGAPITIETGKLAKLAEGSVVVQQGETVVLVAVTVSPSPTQFNFFPLTCDYRERSYSAGRIPGGFFKREGRPTERETLSSRLMDRPIRPLFPKGFAHEVLIMATVLASDGQHDPDVLAVLGASAALRISSLPFPDALGVVRVGCIDGKFVANPTYEQLDQSSIDLVVTGTRHGINMLEAGIKEIPESLLADAIAFGWEQLQLTIELQDELAAQAGKPQREDWTIKEPPAELVERIRAAIKGDLDALNQPASKTERHNAVAALQERVLEQFVNEETGKEDVEAAFETVVAKETRKAILNIKQRMDGRGFEDLRQITCETGVLARTHGSALFTRGETQSLCVVTLGTSKDEQQVELLEGNIYKRFMLHYNFPPFSVGEARPVRGPGRREIGHGALAERALEAMMPPKEEFPYSVRVVSEILESNGSSSMASVCAGSMALMDAGVPLKAAVGGVAMGLIKDSDSDVAVLTDIAGLEDHIGDMDFKLTGTRQGTTALQMDIKLQRGLSLELVGRILQQAQRARMQILDKMDAAVTEARTELSQYAPRITTIKIDPDKIREVIGPGGKNIRRIVELSGATIDIEDDGTISIVSVDPKQSETAIAMIRLQTADAEVGQIYDGTVKRTTNFGAFVEILPGKEGLVHVSELADKYVKNVEEVVKVGDKIRVKLVEIDQQGRLNLSLKQALKAEASA